MRNLKKNTEKCQTLWRWISHLMMNGVQRKGMSPKIKMLHSSERFEFVRVRCVYLCVRVWIHHLVRMCAWMWKMVRKKECWNQKKRSIHLCFLSCIWIHVFELQVTWTIFVSSFFRFSFFSLIWCKIQKKIIKNAHIHKSTHIWIGWGAIHRRIVLSQRNLFSFFFSLMMLFFYNARKKSNDNSIIWIAHLIQFEWYLAFNGIKRCTNVCVLRGEFAENFLVTATGTGMFFVVLIGETC